MYIHDHSPHPTLSIREHPSPIFSRQTHFLSVYHRSFGLWETFSLSSFFIVIVCRKRHAAVASGVSITKRETVSCTVRSFVHPYFIREQKKLDEGMQITSTKNRSKKNFSIIYLYYFFQTVLVRLPCAILIFRSRIRIYLNYNIIKSIRQKPRY